MFDLYKANVVRMVKNIFFIGGCIIAFIVTFGVTREGSPVAILDTGSIEGNMIFVSAAMIIYFTAFVPAFTNAEYSDGVIRNKMVAGKTQIEIYLSHLLAHFTGAAIMWLCYVIGGTLGGVNIAESILPNTVILFAVCNYIATMMLVAFRVRKMVPAFIFTAIIFSLTYNAVLIGNFIIMISTEKMLPFTSMLYNISALGPWFVLSGYSDPEANPGIVVQLIISLAVIVLTTLAGTFRLNKRDIL